MNEQGTVLKVYKDHIDLSIIRQEACNSCSASSLCHPGVEKVIKVFSDRAKDLKPGDTISLAIEPQKVLIASFLVYILPLIGMGIGAFIAHAKGLSENYIIAFSFGGLGIMLGFLLIIEKKFRKKKSLNISILN